MNEPTQKPVIFLAFANDKQDTGAGYLRGLTSERNRIRDALERAEQEGWCKVVVEPDVTIDRIFDVFQNKNYQDRIAIFHYGGHADSYELLLESSTGAHAVAQSEGLVSFLSKQRGLQLVFLNGCCTQQQAQDLVQAGVPAVVGTLRTIDDAVATELSVRFYKGLTAGAPIARAWKEAEDKIKTEKGTSNFRAMYWHGKMEEATDRFPWDISYGQDAEIVKEWSLQKAADEPLFDLPIPASYYRKLPPTPFIELRDFKKEEAAIFFGRSAEIKKLHDHITGTQPVILFYGKAGVGKSSLLQAGLAPRIENKYAVKYIRRQAQGLAGTLTQALQEAGDEHGLPPLEPGEKTGLRAKIEELQKALAGSMGFARQVLENELQKLTAHSSEPTTLLEHWRRIEEKTGKPLLIILDQVEETFTRPLSGGELAVFAEAVRNIFDHKDKQPQGKLILSFRKEYHSEIRGAFQSLCSEVFLPALDRKGVIATVEGLTRHPNTRKQYRLEIDENLPVNIADDLLEDEESPVAPMLQILLTKLWRAAVANNREAPRFTLKQYQALKQEGAIMSEFFEQQMQQLRAWQEKAVDSGLALDVLYHHTTPAGMAGLLRREKLLELYQHCSEIVDQLIGKCKELYLLTEVQSGASLSHHMLAPVVIKDYSISVKPGQQAARILNSKADEKESWLNEADLEIVEKGKEGMRQLNAIEVKLLQKSREEKARREREKKRNRVIRYALATAIFLFAILAGWQWRESLRNYKQSKASQLAFIAKDVFKTDNAKALRIAGSAYGILENRSPAIVAQTLSEIFHSQDLRPFYTANFPHDEHVNSAVFSPDGRQILTASEDGFAKLWDQRGNLIHDFSHDGYEVKSAVFSPNGKQILTLAKDDIVRLWEMNGKLIDSDTLQPGQAVDLAEFSTDGLRILTVFAGSDDEKYRDLIHRLKQEEEIYAVIPASNKQRVLTISSYGIVRLHDAEGKILRDIDSSAVSAAFSSDGKRILTVSVDTLSTIRFWDEQGNFLSDFNYKGEVNKAVFSPDGRQILTAANDHTAKLWDFSQKLVHRLPQHGLAVNAAHFSPDGKRIAAALFDGFVRLWDMQGNLLDSLKHGGVVNSAIFSPDGKRILTAARDSTARLWILDEARVVKLSHRGEVKTAVFSFDGSRILTASGDSTAGVWTANGAPIETLRHRGEVIAALFSPEGGQILTVSSDSTATLWTANGDSIKTFKHRDEIYAAAFSPEGKRILTASADSTARLWAANGDLMKTFYHKDKVKVAAFSPDGRRILTANQIVKLWDEQGTLLDSLAHKHAVTSVVFSRDGQQILTASEDNSAKLWNLQGDLLANYGKHTLPVNSAVFSTAGERIITASDDGDAIIWWTPRAIYEWLKTAPVYRLTREEEEFYEIVK
jgi:WD40 repeat protein